MNIKRPTFPLPSSLPAVPSPHFSELFSQNPEIPYLQKATPQTPYKLKSFALQIYALSVGSGCGQKTFRVRTAPPAPFAGGEAGGGSGSAGQRLSQLPLPARPRLTVVRIPGRCTGTPRKPLYAPKRLKNNPDTLI